MDDVPKITAPETAATCLLLLALAKIERELDDRRTFAAERDGLRRAHILLRKAAEELGVSAA